jgi:hypothetical protein
VPILPQHDFHNFKQFCKIFSQVGMCNVWISEKLILAKCTNIKQVSCSLLYKQHSKYWLQMLAKNMSYQEIHTVKKLQMYYRRT